MAFNPIAKAKLEKNKKEAYKLHKEDGWTLEKIGNTFGITRQRVFQWIKSVDKSLDSNLR